MESIVYNLAAPKLHKDSKPYLFSANNNLSEILTLPYDQFIENGLSTKQPILKNEQKAPADLSLYITTGSCYEISLAQSFTKSLSNRFFINKDLNIDITTCLHEAISNAILHGNLQIKSDFFTKEGLLEYHEKAKQRLMLSLFRMKEISIGVWKNKESIEISVSDEGSGFEIPQENINNQFPSGRGLMIINTMADEMRLADDKRTLFMTFYL